MNILSSIVSFIIIAFVIRKGVSKHQSIHSYKYLPKENGEVVIKGIFSKNNVLILICIVMAVICFVGAIQVESYYDDSIVTILLLCTFVLVGLAIWFYFLMNNCEITVTKERVYGKIKFGNRVDLPLNQISAVGQGLFNSLSVATSSGIIKFWLLENREDVYREILKLLSQIQMKNQLGSKNTTMNSGADELKKYKDLLDNDVITQEEFEYKKKQLLGL